MKVKLVGSKLPMPQDDLFSLIHSVFCGCLVDKTNKVYKDRRINDVVLYPLQRYNTLLIQQQPNPIAALLPPPSIMSIP